MWRTDDNWEGSPLDQVVLAARRGSPGAQAELARRTGGSGLDLSNWTEALHPRDGHGRFAHKPGGALISGIKEMLKVPTLAEVKKSEALSPDEKAKIRAKLAKHPVKAKHIVDTFLEATDGELAAGENWYPNAHKVAQAMARREGVDVRTAAGLLANYSPQTPWGRNMIAANEVLRSRQPAGGPGAHFTIDVTPLDDVDEKRYGLMAPSHTKRRAAKILLGEDFNDAFVGTRNKSGALPPKSLKIRAFGELIANGGQSPDVEGPPLVVIDRHAAGVARGIRLTDDDYNIEGPSGSMKKYAVYATAYRDAAKALSKKLGRTVTPEQVQAVTWLVRQRLNNTVKARRSLGNRDTDEALGYFAQYDPDIAQIIGGGMTGYAELSNRADQ